MLTFTGDMQDAIKTGIITQADLGIYCPHTAILAFIAHIQHKGPFLCCVAYVMSENIHLPSTVRIFTGHILDSQE